jgi:hypothetical protein
MHAFKCYRVVRRRSRRAGELSSSNDVGHMMKSDLMDKGHSCVSVVLAHAGTCLEADPIQRSTYSAAIDLLSGRVVR